LFDRMMFIAFLAAAAVLAITPGPGMAYVVARTAAGGRREGLVSCLGTAIGGMVHVVAATIGLSALLAQSATAFAIVKYVGAAYLIYLGIRLLRSQGAKHEAPSVLPQGAARALREGIVVEALNVKTAIFFLAFLPQFVSARETLAPQIVLLGAICVALNTAADVVAVLAAARLVGSSMVRAARERLLRRISGWTMVGLGITLAAARREA
jgi:threonine/homoserine/homoserine lactone efflux protein